MATKVNRTDSSATTGETTPATSQSRRSGPSLNQVSLIGRVVADPQLRYTPNGIAVTNFRLASNGAYETQFHTIVAWRGLAEIADAWLRKGRLVYVSGRLRGRSWKAADGTGRYVLEVIASDIQFLTPKAAGTSPAAATAAA